MWAMLLLGASLVACMAKVEPQPPVDTDGDGGGGGDVSSGVADAGAMPGCFNFSGALVGDGEPCASPFAPGATGVCEGGTCTCIGCWTGTMCLGCFDGTACVPCDG